MEIIVGLVLLVACFVSLAVTLTRALRDVAIAARMSAENDDRSERRTDPCPPPDDGEDVSGIVDTRVHPWAVGDEP